MIPKILNGYHVERITRSGRVEVLKRSFSSDELAVISMRQRLPVILPVPLKDEELAYKVSVLLGQNYYRYSGLRLVAPKFVYAVLLPQNYVYTNYVLSLPKTTTHYRRANRLLIDKEEFSYVKSRGLESRFHIGPSVGFFLNPWENADCFVLYYINPNDTATINFELCLDIAPIEEEHEQEVLSRAYRALGQRSEEPNLIQQVVSKAYEDFRNPEIEKVEEQVGSFRALDSILHFMVKNTRFLLRKLKRLGVEIEPGGKHPYKARNVRTGKTAPIPWRREFKPYFVRKLCEELQIDYDSLLEDP